MTFFSLKWRMPLKKYYTVKVIEIQAGIEKTANLQKSPAKTPDIPANHKLRPLGLFTP